MASTDLQSIIDMLISNMNGKGGASASNFNLLGNDIFGAVTGTSNDKPLLTQEEAISQYQPTLSNILSTGDVNSVEYNLADLISQGVPVVTIKREILKSITEGTIPPEEEDIMMSFVDTLDKEQRSYQEYLRKPIEDSNTKMGLPAKTDRFNPVDIAPEVFQSMLSKMDTAQKGVNAKLAQIDATSPDTTVYEQPQRVAKLTDKVKDARLTDLVKEPDVVPKDYRVVKLTDKVKDVKLTDLVKEPKKPKERKIDAKATAFNKAQINYLKELAGAAAPAPRKRNVGNSQGDMYSNPVNLRDPVAAQQRIMELTAKKISAGLEKMNYTPGNIALIQKLIAARGMQNG